MDSYVRLLRKTSTDKLLFIIDKIYGEITDNYSDYQYYLSVQYG